MKKLSFIIVALMTSSLFSNPYVLSNDVEKINPFQTIEEKSRDVRNYKDAIFDKTLFYTDLGISSLNIGVSKRYSKFYFNFDFDGNIFGDIYTFGNNSENSFNDKVSFMMGFANMGLGTSLQMKMGSFNDSNTVEIGSGSDKVNTENQINDITEKFFLGGNFNLSNYCIKPLLEFTYNENYESVSSSSNDSIDNANTVDNMSIKAGTDFGFGDKEKLYSEVGVFYTYNDITVEQKKRVTSEGSSSIKVVGLEESVAHSVIFDYKFNSKVNDKLSLFGKVDLGFDFGSGKFFITNDSEKKLTKNIKIFNMNSDFDFGGKYIIKSEVLSTTFGINTTFIDINSYNSKSVEDKFNENTKAVWRVFPKASLFADLDWNMTKKWNAKLSIGIPISKEINDSFIKSVGIGFSYKN